MIADEGKPVAELVPHAVTELPDRLVELIEQGLVIPPTKPRLRLPTEGARMRPGYALSDVIIEERHAGRLL